MTGYRPRRLYCDRCGRTWLTCICWPMLGMTFAAGVLVALIAWLFGK